MDPFVILSKVTAKVHYGWISSIKPSLVTLGKEETQAQLC